MTRAEELAEPCPGCEVCDLAIELIDARADAEALAEALEYMANYKMTGTEQTLHIDFQGKAREALAHYRGERPSSIRTLVEGRDE